MINKLEFVYEGEITNMCVTFHPFLSSLSNLIFISHYRNSITRPFKRFCNKPSKSLNSVVNVSLISVAVFNKNV